MVTNDQLTRIPGPFCGPFLPSALFLQPQQKQGVKFKSTQTTGKATLGYHFWMLGMVMYKFMSLLLPLCPFPGHREHGERERERDAAKRREHSQ